MLMLVIHISKYIKKQWYFWEVVLNSAIKHEYQRTPNNSNPKNKPNQTKKRQEINHHQETNQKKPQTPSQKNKVDAFCP